MLFYNLIIVIVVEIQLVNNFVSTFVDKVVKLQSYLFISRSNKMDDNAFQFWERIDKLRNNKSLKDIASDIDVSYATIKDMRSRCRLPKQDTCAKLADYLHTSVDYLMTGTHSSVSDSITPEARYVNEHIEAQALIRAVMRDPALLQALSLVIESAERR